jgi:hypothetical protein
MKKVYEKKIYEKQKFIEKNFFLIFKFILIIVLSSSLKLTHLMKFIEQKFDQNLEKLSENFKKILKKVNLLKNMNNFEFFGFRKIKN